VAVIALCLSLPLFAAVLINICAYTQRRRVETPSRGRANHMPLLVTARWFAFECSATAFAIVSWPFGLALPRQPSTHHATRFALLLPEVGFPIGSLSLLARRLRKAGWQPVVGATLPPGSRIDKAVERLGATVQQIRERHPQADIAVIAHGTSGLLAWRHLRSVGDIVLATLGTAYQGTESCVARACGRMVRGSANVLEPEDTIDRSAGLELIALASGFDAWVLPAAASYESGSFNVEIRGIGHFAFLLSGRIADILLENLGPEPSADHVIADRT
jgi:hypothetical protein